MFIDKIVDPKWQITAGWIGITIFAIGVFSLVLHIIVDLISAINKPKQIVRTLRDFASEKSSPLHFSENGRPINDENWQSLLLVADETRRQFSDTRLGRSITKDSENRSSELAAYAAIINEAAQLYGIYPPSPQSEPIKEIRNEIIFVTNGNQMDARKQDGSQFYRFIHLKTKDRRKVTQHFKEISDKVY